MDEFTEDMYEVQEEKKSKSSVILWALVAVVGIIAVVVVVVSLLSPKQKNDAKMGLSATFSGLYQASKNAFGVDVIAKSELKDAGKGDTLSEKYELKVNDVSSPAANVSLYDFLKKLGIRVETATNKSAGNMEVNVGALYNEKECIGVKTYTEAGCTYVALPGLLDEVLVFDLKKLPKLLQEKSDDISLPNFVEIVSMDEIGGILGKLKDFKLDKYVKGDALKKEIVDLTKRFWKSMQCSDVELEKVTIPSYVSAASAHQILISEKNYRKYIDGCCEIVLKNVKDGVIKLFGQSGYEKLEKKIEDGKGELLDEIATVLGGDIRVLVTLNSQGYANYVRAYFKNKESDYKVEVSLALFGKQKLTDNVLLVVADNEGLNCEGRMGYERTATSLSTKLRMKILMDGHAVAEANYERLLTRDTGLINVLSTFEKGNYLLKMTVDGKYEVDKDKKGYLIDLRNVRLSDEESWLDLGFKYTFKTGKKEVVKPSGSTIDVFSADMEKGQQLIEAMSEKIKGNALIEAVSNHIENRYGLQGDETPESTDEEETYEVPDSGEGEIYEDRDEEELYEDGNLDEDMTDAGVTE